MKFPVDTEIINRIGFITLNSEKSLNALSQVMIHEITETLLAWKDDDRVAAVFLKGSGEKAFCAGGDIRYLYNALQDPGLDVSNGPAAACLEFFVTEYTLDHLIHTYPKPIIVWAHGITMGGGIGLMNGASHRIVTEASLLAMPEISIGLYPDVGATWFLNQLPAGFGLFLGLTAARFSAADSLYLGLADYFYPCNFQTQLIQILTTLEWSKDAQENRQLASATLAKFEVGRPADSEAEKYHREISSFERVTSLSDFETILATMPKTKWFDEARTLFAQGSPTSLGITIEQIRRGRGLSLGDAFRSELNLSVHCSLNPDFPEGVRALLVDKDKNPKWSSCTKEKIQSYFTPLWKAEENPLKGL